MEVPGLHPKAKGKEKLDCKVRARQVCSGRRRDVLRVNQGLLASLESQ